MPVEKTACGFEEFAPGKRRWREMFFFWQKFKNPNLHGWLAVQYVQMRLSSICENGARDFEERQM